MSNERVEDHRNVGWTHDEYMAAPEMASRLHGRILDLEAERDQYRQALQDIANHLGPLSYCQMNPCTGCKADAHEALRIARTALANPQENP